MSDQVKTGDELTSELDELRQQLRALEQEKDERTPLREKLAKMRGHFHRMGSDAIENIRRFTALCGELAGASLALYNRLDNGKLSLWGCWNLPDDGTRAHSPLENTCYDLMSRAQDHVVVLKNLPESSYAKIDPSIASLGLKCCATRVIKRGDACVGTLCLAYKDNRVPAEEDLDFIEMVAAGISAEEKRKDTDHTPRQKEQMLNSILSVSPLGIGYIKRGRIEWSNRSMARTFGCETENDCRETSPAQFYASMEEYRRVQRLFFESLSKGETAETEAQFRRLDGSTFTGRNWGSCGWQAGLCQHPRR